MLLQIIGDLNLNFGPASYASLIQAVVGLIASRLRVFNIDKSAYRKAINEITEKGVEEMSVLTTEILRRKFETNIHMRGEPPLHEDIVAKLQKLVLVRARTFFELENDFAIFKRLNSFLFYNACLGVALFFVATVWVVNLNYFLSANVILIVVEIICIIVMYQKVEKLDQFT